MKKLFILNFYKDDISSQVDSIFGFIEKSTKDLNGFTESKALIFGVEKSISIGLPESIEPIYLMTNTLDSDSIVEGVLKYIEKKDLIIFQDDILSSEAAVKLATEIGINSYTNASSINDNLYIEQKVLSGNMTFNRKIDDDTLIITIDKSIKSNNKSKNNIIEYSLKPLLTISSSYRNKSKDIEILTKEEQKSLKESNFIIVFGRGVGNKKNMQYAESLCKKLNASLGASRPVVMNAWTTKENLVGISGSIVSPKLSILCGVSGAPALYTGIEGSKTIISINTDPDSPIVNKSDVYICDDWKVILENLCTEYSKEN